MNIEDMFTIKTNPVLDWVKEVDKIAELELMYFVLSRNDYELENYDFRVIQRKIGFVIERTKRIVRRTTEEVYELRAMAIDVLRRNESNATQL